MTPTQIVLFTSAGPITDEGLVILGGTAVVVLGVWAAWKLWRLSR